MFARSALADGGDPHQEFECSQAQPRPAPLVHLNQPSFQIAHVALGQSLVRSGHDERRLPKTTLARAVCDALAHAVCFADIGAHAEGILWVRSVEDVDSGAVYLQPASSPPKVDCVETSTEPVQPWIDAMMKSAGATVDQEELDRAAKNVRDGHT